MKIKDVIDTLTAMRDDIKGLTAPSYARDRDTLDAALDVMGTFTEDYAPTNTAKPHWCVACRHVWSSRFELPCNNCHSGSNWEWRGRAG